MKIFTRVLALLLALMMCLPVLAACSGNKTSEEGTPSSPASGPETPSEEVDIDIGPTTNVALNKPTYANGGKELSGNVTDGDTTTAWTAGGVPKYV